jgi:hypothetical protein
LTKFGQIQPQPPLAAPTSGLKSGNLVGFCKRQLTWFRRQPDPEWIELKPDESLEKCARKICEMI